MKEIRARVVSQIDRVLHELVDLQSKSILKSALKIGVVR
jgi:hypothetical protein